MKPIYPTRAQICERIRAIQEATEVTFTDDEVKGILCEALNETRVVPGIEHWEALVVAKCVRALEERSTSAKKDPNG